MRSALIVLCFVSFSSWAQTSVFKKMCAQFANTVDTAFVIESNSHSNNEYDFTLQGTGPLTKMVLSHLHKKANTVKTPFKQSDILTKLAQAATTAWYGSQYTDKSKWKRLEKYFNRSKHSVTTKFNLLTTSSFRIKLMNVSREGYYYDRHGAEGGLNLYKGKKPKTEEEKEEADPVPVPFMTEKALIAQIEKQLNRKGLLRAMKKGVYSYVGVSIEVDQKTLYRSKIPTARVVVFLGARRLQRLKIPK